MLCIKQTDRLEDKGKDEKVLYWRSLRGGNCSHVSTHGDQLLPVLLIF